MAYKDFTLEAAETAFGLVTQLGDLFPDFRPAPVPDWLRSLLERGQRVAALISEKARSEFLVVPVLLATQEFAPDALAIFSGQRLDVDPERGLVGECDFILALTPPVPRLRAPLVTILEAKKGDIEGGLGQCLAQMVGARLFNERSGQPARPVFGCVTTGEDWQFLRLEGTAVVIHRSRFFLDNVGGILGALRDILLKSGAGA